MSEPARKAIGTAESFDPMAESIQPLKERVEHAYVGLCPHVPAEIAAPSAAACEECGSTWNLRLCASCGYVGCCESQAGHARDHALGVDHPVIFQLPVGSASFVWCYAENRYLA